MEKAIKVFGIEKTFISETSNHKIIKALNDISLEVNSGEILGILGPNGAGKTTFLNILSTLLLPDKGTIEILGIESVLKNFDILRKMLNMSSGYPNFPWSLTIEENLRFYGRLYGLSGKLLRSRIEKLIEMFELGYFAKLRFDELSSGTKQRLALAKAMLNEPKIIFLDEPTVGLDPDVAAKTRQIILNILKSSKVTVLLTTHNMQEAELMCQRIAFIKEGKILRLATPTQLKEISGKKDLEEVFIDLVHQKEDVFIQKDFQEPMIEKNVPESYIFENIQPHLSEQILLRRQPRRLQSGLGRSADPRGGVGAPKTEMPWPSGHGASQWFNRTLSFSYRNFLFAIRNLFAFVELIFWPVVSLISIGLLGSFLQLQEKALAFVLTGAVTAGVLQVTQLDVAYSLLYEVWSKSMKHTFLTPVGVSESLFGSWLIGIVRGSIIFMILGSSAVLLFGFKFPSWTVTFIFLIGIFACAFLLGLLVNVLLLFFGQKAEITAWMFAYLFMLLCGIYYPIDTLPPFFYYLSQIVPITYFLEYFRGSFGFQSQLDHILLKGFGLVVFYGIVGLMMMRWAFYQARKKGIIVRLSE